MARFLFNIRKAIEDIALEYQECRGGLDDLLGAKVRRFFYISHSVIKYFPELQCFALY